MLSRLSLMVIELERSDSCFRAWSQVWHRLRRNPRFNINDRVIVSTLLMSQLKSVSVG